MVKNCLINLWTLLERWVETIVCPFLFSSCMFTLHGNYKGFIHFELSAAEAWLSASVQALETPWNNVWTTGMSGLPSTEYLSLLNSLCCEVQHLSAASVSKGLLGLELTTSMDDLDWLGSGSSTPCSRDNPIAGKSSETLASISYFTYCSDGWRCIFIYGQRSGLLHLV